jgi:hypothetical protein
MIFAEGWSIGPLPAVRREGLDVAITRDDEKTELMPILPAERDPRLITVAAAEQ